MRVEAWCRTMALSPAGGESRLEQVMSWDDPGADAGGAAERAWRMTNSYPAALEGWMVDARRRWDELAGGRSIGVGDVVVVGGARFLCTPDGFARS